MRHLVKHFLLTYEYVDDFMSRRLAHRDGHLAHALLAAQSGELLMGGMLCDRPDSSALLFLARDVETVQIFISSDPYICNGLVKRWTLREWQTVIGKLAISPIQAPIERLDPSPSIPEPNVSHVCVEYVASQTDWALQHLCNYLESNGVIGHCVDYRAIGGRNHTTTLILRTVGRRTGRPLPVPVIYDRHNDEFVIVASKGGSALDPQWYLNLTANSAVDIQVANKQYASRWRVAAGDERKKLWDKMVDYFPPYESYQARTSRQIPIIILTPRH